MSSVHAYEDTGALATLGHALGGGAAVNYGFNYNRALQITSRSTDNDLYAWTNHYNVTRSYTANGLDQYGRIMGDTPAWDSRGNLAAYRGSSYGYDGENRLAAVNLPSGTVTTVYDPAGRLRQAADSTATQFLYDGDQLIAEYNASGGALVGRYVPGAGANETALAYDSGGTKSWYHGDVQGSVVAASDTLGNAVTINQYGPYGEPGTVYQGRNQGRVRYTGQTILSEAGTTTGINQILYNYRARIYAPKLGRFLQTDPIGAQDDRNLYAYVRNDPINRADPTGLLADAAKNLLNKPVPGFYTQTSSVFDFTKPPTFKQTTVGELGSELLGAVGAIRSVGAVRAAGTGAEEMVSLYRGVDALHPGYSNALNGVANPIGGSASTVDHVLGTTASNFTSWTTDYSVAEAFATRQSGAGVVLSNSFPKSSVIPSPLGAAGGEAEALIAGPTSGASIYPVP